MKQHDRDALQERVTGAAERVADELAACRRERRAAAQGPPQRGMRRPFRGAMLLRFPGFADHWTRIVPAECVLAVRDRGGEPWRIILCSCGEQAVTTTGMLAECPGCPSRWFFDVGRSIRVHDFPVAEAAA